MLTHARNEREHDGEHARHQRLGDGSKQGAKLLCAAPAGRAEGARVGPKLDQLMRWGIFGRQVDIAPALLAGAAGCEPAGSKRPGQSLHGGCQAVHTRSSLQPSCCPRTNHAQDDHDDGAGLGDAARRHAGDGDGADILCNALGEKAPRMCFLPGKKALGTRPVAIQSTERWTRWQGAVACPAACTAAARWAAAGLPA